MVIPTEGAARRNRAAGTILPALVVGVVYLLLVRPGAVDRLEETERDLATARSRVPAPESLDALRLEAGTLRDDVRAARETRSDAVVAASGTTPPPRAGESVSTWLARVSGILTRHGVALVEDEPSTLRLPADLRARLAPAGPSGEPVRRMRLVGSYGSIVRALADLELADRKRVVLGLEMDVDDGTGLLNWTLTIG
ncbi:MAG: hypothetical protein ACF8XB_14720 [Planctomycetota bacterium JB042]